MADKSQLQVDLKNLVRYIGTNQTVSLVNIELYYDTAEITWTLPPQQTMGTSTVTAIWIQGQQYTTAVAWTRAWTQVVEFNQSQGVVVSVGRPPVVTAVNLATAQGIRLTNSATITQTTAATTVTTTQVVAPSALVPGPKGDLGQQGLQGVGIQDITVNTAGELIITFTDGRSQSAGSVRAAADALTLAVASVTAVPYGQGSLATVTQVAANSYQLAFQLEKPNVQPDIVAFGMAF
jgi:hypothetical protein